MNLFRTKYISVFLFSLIQLVSGQANFTNMNLTQVPVGQNDSEETDIHLSKNLISRVEDNEFVRFPYLSKLFLDHNQISFLSDLAFNGTLIQRLIVSNNKLTALPKFASIGLSLQHLHASYNLIEKIGKDEFKEVNGLKSLFINSNELTFVHPEAFSDCANAMSFLQLSQNTPLTSIPAEIFRGMGQLDQLEIQGGALTSFPDFRYLPVNNSLTKLFISSSHIGDLPTKALYKLGKLNHLFLNSLGMTRVPDFSRQSDNLQKLFLGETNITDIPNTAFDNLPLRSLYLPSNKLTKLPNLQSIQSTLTNLFLSGNNFSTATCEDIHAMIANCSLLNNVALTNTNIKTFPDILSLNRSFDIIKILNPWTMRCDCAMEWMIGLEDRVQSTDITGTSMPCAAPPRLAGRKWATIDRIDLCHDNEAVSCNFKLQLLSTTSTTIPSPLCTEGSLNETVGGNILAAALGVSLGVVFLIFAIVVVLLVCHMRSSSSSNKSRDNKQDGEDNHDYLQIVDGNSTYLNPALLYTEPTEPPTNTDEAGVYDDISDLALSPVAKVPQAGVVTGGVPAYSNVITSGATGAVDQNVN